MKSLETVGKLLGEAMTNQKALTGADIVKISQAQRDQVMSDAMAAGRKLNRHIEKLVKDYSQSKTTTKP